MEAIKKIRTTNYVPTPGESYGEWCWNRGITAEWRTWIEDANDDWVLNEIRRWIGRDMLTDEQDVLCIALFHEAGRRGLDTSKA